MELEPTDMAPGTRCLSPSGEAATYLGVQDTPPWGNPECSCVDAVLRLHTYLVDGEPYTSSSRLAPRPLPETPHGYEPAK